MGERQEKQDSLMIQEQQDYKKLYEAEREKTEVLLAKIEEAEKEIEELDFKLKRIKGRDRKSVV